MRRKVVLHGPSTLTISLPTRWIKKHGVKKGDELEVEELEKTLKISTSKEYAPVKTIKADFSELSDETIDSVLAIIHKSGYDEVEITFNDPHVVKIIQDRISSMLIGYEVIEQGNKKCLVRSISTTPSQEFSSVWRRTFLVSLSMARTSLEAVKTGNSSKIEEAMSLEQTSNRLTNFCHRILNKQVSASEKAYYHYIIIWLLESVCDDYKSIVKLAKSNKNHKVSAELLEVYEEINELLQEYYNVYYKYSDKHIDQIRAEHKRLSQKLLDIINSGANKDAILSVYLMNVLQRIHDALGSTTGLHY